MKTIETLIKGLKLDYCNPNINSKNFPYEKPSKKIEIIDFKRTISSEEAIEELKKQGLRPATMTELLTYAPEYFEKKRDYCVVALGSVWRDSDGSRYVGCLFRDGSERDLGLFWLGDGWGAVYRFLAVRKSGSKKLSPSFDLSALELRIKNLEDWKERITNG